MKIRCRILDNLNANGALREAGTEHELDLSVADIEMLIERRVIEPLDHEDDDDVMLIGSSVQPSVFVLDGQRIALGELVAAAQHRSGLPAQAWNELPDDNREALIEDERIRLGAELVVFAEQARQAEPVVAALESNEHSEGGIEGGTAAPMVGDASPAMGAAPAGEAASAPAESAGTVVQPQGKSKAKAK